MAWLRFTDDPRYVVLDDSGSEPDGQNNHLSSRIRYSFVTLAFLTTIVLVAILLAVLQLAHVPRTCIHLPIRREWRALTSEERADFIDAIQCIARTPSTWQTNRTIYDDIAILHGGVGNLCESTGPRPSWEHMLSCRSSLRLLLAMASARTSRHRIKIKTLLWLSRLNAVRVAMLLLRELSINYCSDTGTGRWTGWTSHIHLYGTIEPALVVTETLTAQRRSAKAAASLMALSPTCGQSFTTTRLLSIAYPEDLATARSRVTCQATSLVLRIWARSYDKATIRVFCDASRETYTTRSITQSTATLKP